MAENYDDENTEYQLNESGDDFTYDVTPEDEPQAQTQSSNAGEVAANIKQKLPLSKKNIFILIISIFLFILIGYKIYSLIFSGHKTPVKTQPLQIMQAPTPTPTPIPGASPALTQPTVSPEVLQNIAAAKQATEDLRNNLQQQQQADTSRFSSLEGMISNLKDTIQNMQGNVQQLNSQMQQQLARQKAEAMREANLHRMQERLIRQSKQYFVKAVIPGRAWLGAMDGSEMTVTIGSQLPGYGDIVAIDPYSGIIKTSSEISIYYGIGSE